jgi:recombination protein RecT
MGQEIQVRDEDIRSLVHTQVWAKRKEFANLLPAEVDADTFAGLAASAMWKTPALAVAALNSPESLVNALRDCARLGHEPGTENYYLTVRGGAVLGIEGYQGVIQRMFNAGAVQAVHAEVVTYQEKLARRDPLPPEHQVPGGDWLDRNLAPDNLKGVYAYAVLEGGVISRVVVMGRAQVMTHRDKAGKKDGFSQFWDGPFGVSMWLKTAAHELEKWVPTSASYRKERARADAEMARLLGQRPETVPDRPEQAAPPVPVQATVGERTDGQEPPRE